MPPRKAALAFVFVTIMLDMIAIGLIAPVLPKLILAFRAGNTQDAAQAVGIFGTVFALMQFFFSPVLGVLSDRFGRRPVILLSNVGLGLDYLIMALAPTLGWLFVGRVISGITASSVSTGMAYVSDIVAAEKRAAAFGLIGAAFGIGFILGPAVGGLLGNFDTRLPFWAAGILSLVNAAYGFFVLPESLPHERRRAFTLRRANPIGGLTLLRSHPELVRLSVIQFIENVAHEVFNIWALYAIFRFAWSEGAIGLSLALVGVCSVIVSVGLVGPVVARLGERRAFWLGQLFGGIGMIIAGLARTGAAFFACIPVIGLWGISAPAAQGLMTRRVSGSEQGELQGAINSLRAIATIIGPGLFAFTFSYFIQAHRGWSLPGFPWFLAGAMLFLTTALSFRVARLERDEPAAVEPPEPSPIMPPSV